MGRRSGSRDLLLNFRTPLYIYGTAEDTNFKFGRLTTSGTIQKLAKLGQMGKRPRLLDLLLNFGTPFISTERLKIQI